MSSGTPPPSSSTSQSASLQGQHDTEPQMSIPPTEQMVYQMPPLSSQHNYLGGITPTAIPSGFQANDPSLLSDSQVLSESPENQTSTLSHQRAGYSPEYHSSVYSLPHSPQTTMTASNEVLSADPLAGLPVTVDQHSPSTDHTQISTDDTSPLVDNGDYQEKARQLRRACYHGKLDVVKKLVEQDHVNPNDVRDNVGKASLRNAFEGGHKDVVQYPVEDLEYDVDLRYIYGDTPLYNACEGGRKDVVQYLVEDLKCDVDVRDSSNQTPLHEACLYRHKDVVEYLVEKANCDVNVTDDEGITPLDLARDCDHTEIVDYLESRQPSAQQVIEVQPKDITCKPGEKADLFIVLKTSTSACTYQWYFKDEPIPETDSDYGGSTSDRLCVHNCLSKHKGAYKCIITDSSGRSVTSEEATISLSGEPIDDSAVLKLLGGILEAAAEIDFSVYGIDIKELVDGRVELTYDEVKLIMKGNSATQSIAENLKEAIYLRLEEKRLYQEAMAMGYKISLCYTKILALGPGQVGKSTFLYRMIGLMKGNIQTCQKTDPGSLPQCSTGVTELHEACIRYTSMTGALTDKTWHVFDESNKIESQLNGLIALLIKQINEQESKLESTAPLTATNTAREHIASVQVSVETIDNDHKAASAENQESNLELNVDQNISEQKALSDSHSEMKASQRIAASDRRSTRKPVTVPRKQTVIERVIHEFEELQMKHRHSLIQKITFHMLFNIADIGGQPAFLEMLPSLTIGPALYLVFMKLLEGLKTRYPTAFKCKDNRGTKLCQNYTYTSEEVIFTALSSIACFGNSDEEVEMYVANQADRKKTNSLALLVGTHADKIKDPARLSAIDDELKRHIEETEFYTEGLIHSQKFLQVNNYSAANEEIQEHRQLLEDILTVKFRQFDIPARWLMLSICLKLLAKNQGTHEVSFDDCVKIGRYFKMSKTMVKVALQFLHKYIGLVMYFPNHEHLKNVVICDPQAVFTSISELVFKIYDPTNLQVTEAQHDHFVQTGCFSPQDVEPVSKDGQTQSKVLSISTLIDLLVHLNIAAEIPSSDPTQEQTEGRTEEKQSQGESPEAALHKLTSNSHLKRKEYIFPAVLQTAEVDTLKRVKNLRQAHEEQLPEPIYIFFKTGYMPLGFVCALSAKLLGEPKFQLIFTEGSEAMTYKNMLKFRYDGEFDILIISGPKYCEFQVTRHTGKADFWSEDCCPQIKKTICDAADSVVRSMKHGSLYKLSKGYELAFKCPQHPDADIGHEPLCKLVYERTALVPNVPKKIQCAKSSCSTSLPLTPEMKMWFGEALPEVPLEVSTKPLKGNVLKITAKGGSKPLKFQWFKDEEPLTDSTSYSGSTTAELVIEGTDSELKEMYKCRVTDRKDTTKWSGEIKFDPFVLSLEIKGLKQKEINKLIDHGYERMDDFKYLKTDNVSLKEVSLKGPEICRVRDFLMKEIKSEEPPSSIADHHNTVTSSNHPTNPTIGSVNAVPTAQPSNFTSTGGPTSTASNTGLTTAHGADRRVERFLNTSNLNIDPTQLNTEIELADMAIIAQYFGGVELYMDQLGLTPAKQADIRKAVLHSGTQTAIAECLRHWRKSDPSAATYQALVKILLKLGKETIARKICEYAFPKHK